MTVNIDGELAERIQTAAAKHNQSPNGYVLRSLEGTLLRDEDERPDTYDPSHPTGCSMAQFVEKMRVKHGLPENWGARDVELTEAEWASFDALDAQLYPEVDSSLEPTK